MTYYIYTIQNQKNLKIYIGQTVNVKRRWRSYKNMSKHVREGMKKFGDKGVQLIHIALAKYGFDNFIFHVIEQREDKKDADDEEIFWIEFFQSRNPSLGYNVAPGGSGVGSGPDHPMYGLPAHNRLFTDEQELAICSAYVNDKIPITKLHKIYNCKQYTLFKILKRHGVTTLGNAVFSKGKHFSPKTEFKKGQKAHNKLFTESQELEIIEKYQAGTSTPELSKIYKCHKSVISRLLMRHNIERRNAGYYRIDKTPHNKLFTEKQEKEICQYYLANKTTLTKMGQVFGCDRTVIADTLKKHDIR